MRIALAFLLLCYTIPLAAQFEKNYIPVISRGPLPKDFVTLSSQKYEKERSTLSKTEQKNIRAAKEQFILESSFGLDRILLSGNTLFNDPLGGYVNRVADKLLERDTVLRGQVRFYVIKSSVVNAFTTPQGAIFVTMGLLAQLENESQLAFILSHELVHYTEKHAIEKYVEAAKLENGKGAYKNRSLNDQVLAQCAFSKEQEKEADEKGLQLFLKSDYSTEHLIGVYDVLKYSFLPFDDITYDKSFLENDGLKFPDAYYLKHTLAIDTRDKEEDEESSHPSVKHRREKTIDSIKGISNVGKSDYLVGQNEFEQVRESARFEVCRLYLKAHRYESTIYSSYLLSRKYPENIFLKKLVGTALVALGEHSMENKYGEITYNSDSVQGKAQALYHLLDQLHAEKGDLPVVALAYVLGLKNAYPNDISINALYEQAMWTVVKKAEIKYSFFRTKLPQIDTSKAATPSLPKDSVDELAVSKYEKLRAQETVDQISPASEDRGRFIQYALLPFMGAELKNEFDRWDTLEDRKERISLDGELRKHRYYFDDKVVALGMNKVVVVDPYYARVNAKEKKSKYRYVESENGQVDFAERISKAAKAANLDCQVLNSKNLKEGDVETMNDIILLEDYMNDRLAQQEDIDVPFPDQQKVNELTRKYGTTKFMLTGAISVTDHSMWKPVLIMLTVLFPFDFPFTIPALVNGEHKTLYFSVVFDVQTDEVKYATFRTIQNRTRGYILNGHLYDVFNQLKSARK